MARRTYRRSTYMNAKASYENLFWFLAFLAAIPCFFLLFLLTAYDVDGGEMLRQLFRTTPRVWSLN